MTLSELGGCYYRAQADIPTAAIPTKSYTGCSRSRVGLGRFMILGQAGESERFRCAGTTLRGI